VHRAAQGMRMQCTDQPVGRQKPDRAGRESGGRGPDPLPDRPGAACDRSRTRWPVLGPLEMDRRPSGRGKAVGYAAFDALPRGSSPYAATRSYSWMRPPTPKGRPPCGPTSSPSCAPRGGGCSAASRTSASRRSGRVSGRCGSGEACRRREPVGAENSVRPAQATIRYSWMRPPRRSALRSRAASTSLMVEGVASERAGGRWPMDRCGRCAL